MHNPNTIIEQNLDDRIDDLGRVFQADILTFIGPIQFGADDEIREAVEAISAKQPKLCVILETGGGYIEMAQRIADTFRHHYQDVEYIIPNYAFSAGTVLAMSGDAIWMDYYSVLGPIDPQLERPGSAELVPALGYLEQYHRLMRKSTNGTLNDAELAFLLNRFDPAELYQYEQAMRLSISLLKEWLVKYKFKDWVETDTTKTAVTPQMREQRAEEIANELNNTQRWHSHGRGISMHVLVNELNLRIGDFGAIPEKNEAVRMYYRLLKNFMIVSQCRGVVHTKETYNPYLKG